MTITDKPRGSGEWPQHVGPAADTGPVSSPQASSTPPSVLGLIVRRFLVPRAFVSLYALFKWRSHVSTHAEVELSHNLRMGTGCRVSSFTKLKCTDGIVHMGAGCTFGTGCFIASGSGGVQLGDHVLCGPNVVIAAINYRYDSLEVPLKQQGVTSRGIVIGSNVWLGSGSVVLDGAAIGNNCIVVANSLVNRRYPDNCIIQGNPAKVILNRSRGNAEANGNEQGIRDRGGGHS